LSRERTTLILRVGLDALMIVASMCHAVTVVGVAVVVVVVVGEWEGVP
jgi:hypothetical protein